MFDVNLNKASPLHLEIALGPHKDYTDTVGRLVGP